MKKITKTQTKKKSQKKQKNSTKAIKHIDHFKYVSEEDFLNVVNIISKKLAYKFKFGYHNIDDMKQQISIFALEGLKNYDNKRPLENFLWTHVRNRLFNYKRDNYQRPDKPCLSCPLHDPSLSNSISGCLQFSDKNDCDAYTHWNKRNFSKKNLMYLTTIDEVKDYGNTFQADNLSILDNISNSEIIDILEEKLIDEHRTIYLKMKDGSKVSRSDTQKLLSKIKEIIELT